MKKQTIIIAVGFVLLSGMLAFGFLRINTTQKIWNGSSGHTSVYATLNSQGRVLTYTFMSNNQMIISVEGQCLCLAQFEGRIGTQYFDHLWKTTFPHQNWVQDFNYVEKGFIPVALKIKAVNRTGINCIGFPPVGKNVFKFIEFSKNQMKLDGQTYVRFDEENLKEMQVGEAFAFLSEL